MTRKDLSRRLRELEGEGEAAPFELVITDSVVDENGENAEAFRQTRCWQDESGEWHSVREDLR